MARSRVDAVDSRADQGLKFKSALSDDWHTQLQVIPCSQEFKNGILRENGQEASIHQIHQTKFLLIIHINSLSSVNDSCSICY